MPQVLLSDLDGHPAGNRMTRVRVPHPVRAGFRESVRALRVAMRSQHAGAVIEESLDLIVESGGRNPLLSTKVNRELFGAAVFIGAAASAFLDLLSEFAK